MAGIWYRTGTVALTNGSRRVTGTGATWLDQATGPVMGNTFWGPDSKPYEVERVISNTELDLVEAYAGVTATGVSYKINTTEKFSVASLAGQVAATLQYAQAQYSNMSLWASGDLPADVPVILPDGVSTKDVPNVAKMLSLIAAKLTETAQLKALDVPSTVFGRARLADADAAAQLTALGASAFGRDRLADADAAAQRTALGLKKASMVDILGNLVAPDAGGLTGAIIERGSNANGEFVKFADGTLLCFQRFTAGAGTAVSNVFGTTSGVGYISGDTAWAFPAAFFDNPFCFGSPTGRYDHGGASVHLSNVSKTSAIRRTWFANFGDYSVDLFAFGRWR